MAKKTLTDLKKCPIDFLYLWASDEFISQLGSRAKTIKEKRYYQQQSLYKTITENVNAGSSAEYMEVYNEWASEIAKEIKNTYGYTPAEILVKLAMGEEIAGKNYKKGIMGIGDTLSTTFSANSSVQVDSTTGKIVSDGKVIKNQTPIYGVDGSIVGYSAILNGMQYQSEYKSTVEGVRQYGSFAYSDVNGVYTYNGQQLSSDSGTVWQNANNYLPIIDSILTWVTSIVNQFFTNRTLITTQNTVPMQSEWIDVESDNTGLWIAGGAAAIGIVLLSMDNPFGGKKKKNK